MKKFKIALWIIAAGLCLLLFFQNRSFFLATQRIELDLYLAAPFQTPEIFNVIWFLLALGVGFLIAYIWTLNEKMKLNKLVKQMKAKEQRQEAMILQLKEKMADTVPSPSCEVSSDETVDDVIDVNPVTLNPPQMDSDSAND